jgi:hypothetical protein
MFQTAVAVGEALPLPQTLVVTTSLVLLLLLPLQMLKRLLWWRQAFASLSLSMPMRYS